jgi:hypothetical protein
MRGAVPYTVNAGDGTEKNPEFWTMRMFDWFAAVKVPGNAPPGKRGFAVVRT